MGRDETPVEDVDAVRRQIRAHPYASAFLLALAVFTWPVSVPVLRYMHRQDGGGQAGGDQS